MSTSGFSDPVVLLLAGSPSDLDLVLDCEDTLRELDIPCDIRVLSAHRTPAKTAACAENAQKNGFQVLIAFAGLSAQLAGVAAAHSLLPVIAVPRAVGPLNGIDATLASLQLPPGTPAAVVAIDGAKNAALLAARILAVANSELRDRLREFGERNKERYAPEHVAAAIEKARRARK
ncbi:MAG: 5-(carboxyamino)imidazole ribonucleotide mutase [bacterium]|nr:5-(carboxyamino)imidazole ribonucleotide mutase [bacterium]